jgi:hypothetical protein
MKQPCLYIFNVISFLSYLELKNSNTKTDSRHESFQNFTSTITEVAILLKTPRSLGWFLNPTDWSCLALLSLPDAPFKWTETFPASLQPSMGGGYGNCDCYACFKDRRAGFFLSSRYWFLLSTNTQMGILTWKITFGAW